MQRFLSQNLRMNCLITSPSTFSLKGWPQLLWGAHLGLQTPNYISCRPHVSCPWPFGKVWMLLRHKHLFRILHVLNCGCGLLYMRRFSCIRVSTTLIQSTEQIPGTYNAIMCAWPYLLDKMIKQVEEKSVMSAVSWVWWNIVHTRLFLSSWSPKISIKRQSTGNFCTAASTKITYGHEKYLFTVVAITNSWYDEFCASEKE